MGMIDKDKVGALSQLVELVRTRLPWVMLTMFLVAVCAFGFVLWRHFDAFLQNKFPEHDFHQNLSVDTNVQASLETLRSAVSADRVIVIQFHNGTKGDGNLPFRSSSATYADVAPGIAFDPTDQQNVPLSYMTEVNERIWTRNPTCATIKKQDLKSNILKTRWDRDGTNVTYYCPISAIDDTPIGILMISYLDPSKFHPSDQVIYSTMNQYSMRISGYLQSVHNQK